jgi:hypothetical protein
MCESLRLKLAALGALALLAGFSGAQAQNVQKAPDYIRADRGPISRGYGAKIAARIFSDEFTATRADAIRKSAANIPGFKCRAEPQMGIIEILPYPVSAEAVSWVERYAVDCEPLARRNLMLFLENEKSRAIELLPGETKADPRLQRDAIRGAKGAAAGANSSGCDKSWVTDTKEIEPYKNATTPWSERWSFDLCGTRAEVEMSFFPAGAGGTTFTAKLLR